MEKLLCVLLSAAVLLAVSLNEGEVSGFGTVIQEGSEATAPPYAEHGQRSAKVPVLSYHSFTNDDEKIAKSDLFLTPETFELQLIQLLQMGYTPIFASELAAKVLPDKPVVITMDDGYRDNYDLAYPIMEKHQVKATIFLISGHMANRSHEEHLSWDQVREMQDSGLVEFQSHTYQLHREKGLARPDEFSKDGWQALLRDDARRAEEVFLRELGRAPTVLCCPYGIWSEEVAELYAQTYDVIFTGEYGMADLGRNSLLGLPRIWVTEHTALEQLLTELRPMAEVTGASDQS